MNLNKISNDLKQHKGRNKSQILSHFIQIRLTDAINSYYNELDKTIEYLAYRNELKVLSKLNKEEGNKHELD